ncbi:MAG: hypothetical protein INQ03_21970 [Candidatus Heimdallarchaeota archaeon]|nr:hypothetical protein [Candidatus Heimdallarchaeota archaeon]
MAEVTSFMIFFMIITVFSLHVVLLAMEIVMSLLALIFEFFNKSSHDLTEKVTPKYLKFIGINYASQQVYLTASTVFVLAFFPNSLVFAGKALFYPLTFLVTVFAIRLAFLAYYYYGRGTLSDGMLKIMGLLWTLSGVVLLYLDTILLGWLSNPVGIESVDADMVPTMNVAATFFNPVSFGLLLLLVAFAVTIGLNLLAFIHITRVNKITDEDTAAEDFVSMQYLKFAFFTGIAVVVTIVIYVLILLGNARYKFDSLFGVNDAAGSLNVLWMVLLAVVLYLVHMFFSFKWWSNNKDKNSLSEVADADKKNVFFQTLAITLSFAVLVIADFISQTPYLVVAPDLEATVPFVNVVKGVNERAASIDVYSVGIFAMFPLIAAFGVWVYFFFSGMLSDKPLDRKNLAGIIE